MSSTVKPASAPSDAVTKRTIDAYSARNGTVTSTWAGAVGARDDGRGRRHHAGPYWERVRRVARRTVAGHDKAAAAACTDSGGRCSIWVGRNGPRSPSTSTATATVRSVSGQLVLDVVDGVARPCRRPSRRLPSRSAAARSALPSRLRSSLSVRSPAASLIRPLASSMLELLMAAGSPSTRSQTWCGRLAWCGHVDGSNVSPDRAFRIAPNGYRRCSHGARSERPQNRSTQHGLWHRWNSHPHSRHLGDHLPCQAGLIERWADRARPTDRSPRRRSGRGSDRRQRRLCRCRRPAPP